MRILSGIQASGSLHLGNYLGALKKFADMQSLDATSLLYDCRPARDHGVAGPGQAAVADARNRRLLSGGRGRSAKSTIFPQSGVRAHSELSGCLTAWRVWAGSIV